MSTVFWLEKLSKTSANEKQASSIKVKNCVCDCIRICAQANAREICDSATVYTKPHQQLMCALLHRMIDSIYMFQVLKKRKHNVVMFSYSSV